MQPKFALVFLAFTIVPSTLSAPIVLQDRGTATVVLEPRNKILKGIGRFFGKVGHVLAKILHIERRDELGARGFYDSLDTRSFYDSLDARSFYDELGARGFYDELEARGFDDEFDLD